MVGGVAGVVKKGVNKSVQVIRGMFKKIDAETQAAITPKPEAAITPKPEAAITPKPFRKDESTTS